MNESLQLLSTCIQSQLYEVYGLLQRAKAVSGVIHFRVPLILWILYKKSVVRYLICLYSGREGHGGWGWGWRVAKASMCYSTSPNP